MDFLRRHGAKIAVFVLNAAVVALGVLGLKVQRAEKALAEARQAAKELEAQQQNLAAYAEGVQERLAQSRGKKMDDVAQNPSQVQIQKPVTVTQNIPAKTEQVKVEVKSSSKKTRSS